MNRQQGDLEDDVVVSEKIEIVKSPKMKILLKKFGEEECQGSGKKRIVKRKVVVPTKRGHKSMGPRAVMLEEN